MCDILWKVSLHLKLSMLSAFLNSQKKILIRLKEYLWLYDNYGKMMDWGSKKFLIYTNLKTS